MCCKDLVSPSRLPPSMRARSRAHTLYALLLFCDLSSSDTSHPEFADSSHPRSRLRISRSLFQKLRLPFCCFCGRLEVLGGFGWSKLGLGLGNPGGVRSVGLGALFRPVSLGERSSLGCDCSRLTGVEILESPGKRVSLGGDCSRLTGIGISEKGGPLARP